MEITEIQHQVIQNQLNAVYGNGKSKIEYVEQSHKQITQRNLRQQDLGKTISKEEQQQEEESYIANIDTSTIWGQVRVKIISYLNSYYNQEDGIALDKTWFSKLDAEIDKNTELLVIKAPTKFYKDWIESKYIRDIEQACLALSLKLNKYDPIIVDNSDIATKELVLN